MLKRLLNGATHKIFTLPVLVLMPHSRCNCRCVMCDIWKANQERREISVEELTKHIHPMKDLGVRRVALSGGEALMHPNLWKLCELIHSIGARISLLSTGITLKHHAVDVVSYCDDVIVSLDGSREIHNKIRNLPGAFEKLEEGVSALKNLKPDFRVTGRTVLQKQNFRDFHAIIRAAKTLGLDQVSFLGADVSSEAFNRAAPWSGERVSEVALSLDEIPDMENTFQESFIIFKKEFDAKFIAESREKILAISQHYRAIAGVDSFPAKKCNAPWVSAVIESNGDVLPCFFHKAYGNVKDGNLAEVINSRSAISFRRGLKIGTDPTCQRCVCSLRVPLLASVT